MNNHSYTPAAKVKNIVISGTNFWNPGDDFVRDGVIRILREVFSGEMLNFLFYNFNEDFAPRAKFAGIGNDLARGDLEKYYDSVDAVVIAGLSAGNEIKDLYRWVLANNLEEKVYLIGAGYENGYVEQHIGQDPEATIFRKARLIIGRTGKTPEFIRAAALPYHHLNCPAILSVPAVKDISPGRQVKRIGFSIQIPPGEGLANHSCAREMYDLAVAILREVAGQYEVEVVAHHKTEYFHFLKLLRGENIPVIFSSFYQDLHQIYPRYDLMVTTRLHASLFANGHGLPGIIINDTDRHTHTLEGFKHSIWVQNRPDFDRAFNHWKRADLMVVAHELAAFKANLLAQYVAVLGKSFSKNPPAASVSYSFDSEKKEQSLVRSLFRPGMIALDVGANIGKYTKLFSLLAGDKGKVFAFEPDPGSVRKLRHLVQRDSLANVQVVNMAVSDTPGRATLNQFPEEYCSWNGLGRPQMEDPKNPSQFVAIVGSVEVETVTLDGFCQVQGITQIDYLKLDVEGAELKALKGATGLLSRQAVRHLQFEVSLKMLEGLNTCARPVFDLLASFGYECHAISESGEIGEVVKDSLAFYDNYLARPAKRADAFGGFLDRLLEALCAPENKKRVHKIISGLEKDYWLEQNLIRYQDTGHPWFDTATFLNWFATHLKPKRYCEIGVRKGRSMAQVLVSSPDTEAYGFDMWIPGYSSDPEKGIVVDNPGPEFVLHQFQQLGIKKLPRFIRGNSHETVPAFYNDSANPQSFDLMLVDGDHTAQGAREDLEIAFAHLAPGGALVFDDICHPSHLDLMGVWDEFARRFPDWLFMRDESGSGTGVAFRPPYENLFQAIGFEALRTLNPPQPSAEAGKRSGNLPVHFFTIVLNGQPFIQHHIEQFRKLPFFWHWHIVEGVAALNHDTAWPRARGGTVPAGLHHGGLSIDGTTEYIDSLKAQFPDNITIYRPPTGKFWDGKREMVNAPISHIADECLLWQVDADELWTVSQLIRTHALFLANPDKTAALFYCHFFVGPELVITSRDTYGNYSSREWLRVWRYKPGDRWAAHEPPLLHRGDQDVGAINPFRHAETEAMGLVFQHFAYAIEAQLRFKESYYGYAGAVEQWRKLQRTNDFPQRLSNHFAWVADAAIVNPAASLGIKRLAPPAWFGMMAPESPAMLDGAERILFVRTDSIGDVVLASAMLEPIRNKYPKAKLAVLCQQYVADLFVACPFVDSVICYDRSKMDDPAERSQILAEISEYQPDVIVNSVRSRDHFSNELTQLFGAARHVAIEGDLDNIQVSDHVRSLSGYEQIIASPEPQKAELGRHGDFLKGLGIEAESLQPAVWTSSANEALADTFFREEKLDSAHTMALFPFTQHGIKDYGMFAEALAAFDDWTFLIFGGPETRSRSEALARTLPGRVLNLTGRTSLREMAAMIRRCRIMVGSDSSGPHIACAVGVPNVVLLGGGHFGRFMPYSSLTSAVVLPMDCFGCNWRCKYSSAHCVTNLAPQVLTKAIAATLQNHSARPRIFAQVDQEGLLNVKRALEARPSCVAAEVIPVPVEDSIPNTWPTLKYGRGVYKEEAGFRWLDTEADVELVVPADGGPAVMSFELKAAPMEWYPRTPLKVAVNVNGQLIREVGFRTDNQIEVIPLNLPPTAQPYHLQFISSTFFVGQGGDRRLTVKLQNVVLAPTTGKDLPAAPAGSPKPITPTIFLPPIPVNLLMQNHSNGSNGSNGHGAARIFQPAIDLNLGRRQEAVAVVNGSNGSNGCRRPESAVSELLKAAGAHIARGDLKSCCASLEQAVDAAPDDIEIVATLGNVRFQMGDFKEARAQYEHAVQLAPQNIILLVQVATTCQRLGDSAGLAAALQQALSLDPHSEPALALQALAQLESRRFGEAANTYQQLLSRNPDKVEWLLAVAKCHFQAGDIESARRTYDRVVGLDPANAIAGEALQIIASRALSQIPSATSAEPPFASPPLPAASFPAAADLRPPPTLQYGAGVYKDEGGFRWLDGEATFQVLVPAGGQPAQVSFEVYAGEMAWYRRPLLHVQVTVNGLSVAVNVHNQKDLILQADHQSGLISVHLPPAEKPHSVCIRTDQTISVENPPRRLAVKLRQVWLAEEKAGAGPTRIMEAPEFALQQAAALCAGAGRMDYSKVKAVYPAFEEALDVWITPRLGFSIQPNPFDHVFPLVARRFESQLDVIRKHAAEVIPFIHSPKLSAIPENKRGEVTPYWANDYFHPGDARLAYAMVACYRPQRIIECGCGNSTKFMRRAATDYGTGTQIICIDPEPRANIQGVADQFHQVSATTIDPAFFDQLKAGDFLFIDGSHLVMNGSDCVHLFLNVLPQLRSGVWVHFHDIFLPYDYAQELHVSCRYNEQYMLAQLFLHSQEWLPALPIYYAHKMKILPHGGGSFWMRKL